MGFGGAFTESSAYVYSRMNPANQKIIREAYFGNADEKNGPIVGNGYSIGRLPLNSCDFSLKSYSFDDVDGDFNLEHFNISHNEKTIMPFIRDCLAISKRPVRIFTSPWSPPAWMKG
jgi:glucosylceramidase